MWALADVVGLFSNNVGPFSPNVGQRVRIFSANVGPNRPMLSGRGIYVLRSLQIASETPVARARIIGATRWCVCANSRRDVHFTLDSSALSNNPIRISGKLGT